MEKKSTFETNEPKSGLFQFKKHSTGSTNLTLTRLNPATGGNSSASDIKSFTINGKTYTQLDLASLTLYQVGRACFCISVKVRKNWKEANVNP